MLEKRNVVPIDLARHPRADQWADHLRHRYSTDWILYSLEYGQPYEISNWQTPPPAKKKRASIPHNLQPIDEVMINAPEKEPEPPNRGKDRPLPIREVKNVVRVWEHNRKVYPGWLFIPTTKYYLFEQSTREWEQAILEVIPELSPLEKLSAMRELVWRREILLFPLSKQVEEVAESILEEIDCQARKIGGKEEKSAQWPQIREAWREIALSLLTADRQGFDRDTFNRRLLDLAPFLEDHPDVAQRVQQEKCLWALYASDYTELNKLLKEWCHEGCDPMWMTRKAAIWAEMGSSGEAMRLLNRSLSIIRRRPHGGNTLGSPSREGWTLWMALAFEHGFRPSTDEELKAPPAFKRWKELHTLQCDAFEQKLDLLHSMKGEPEKKDFPSFDLGVCRRLTIHSQKTEYDRLVSAYRAIRLCEVAGLPPFLEHWVVGSDILAFAADILVKTEYPVASRLALRLVNNENDPVFNRVWSRSRIAAMQLEEANKLDDLVTNVISYALPRVAHEDTSYEIWYTRLQFAIEALSRLVLRLTPERAEEILNQGLKYYRMEGISKKIWFSKPISNLLQRAWESLPISHRVNVPLDILSAPISGLDGFEIPNNLIDPGDLLLDCGKDHAPARDSETEDRWTEIIHLVLRGLRKGGEARKRAAARLIPLVMWERLTTSERDLLAKALWQKNETDADNLPSGTGIQDWVFLLMPEPEPGLAERSFRRKFLDSQAIKGERNLNQFLWQVGNAIASLKNHHRPLKITDEERKSLATAVGSWTGLPVPSGDEPQPLFARQFGLREGIIGLQHILPEINLSSPDSEALFIKTKALNETDTPGFRLFSGIAMFLPDRIEEIVVLMRMGLSSEGAATAEEALIGLQIWHIGASEETSQIPPLPNDLLQEVGVMIATRRKRVLNQALQAAQRVFSCGTAEQRDLIAKMTLHGLSYLIEELRYDRDHDPELDIPLLRWRCVRLALEMAKSGYSSDEAIKRWVEVPKNDPLPEVRHVESATSVWTR